MKSTFASRFALIGTTTMVFGMGLSHANAVTPDFVTPTLVVRFNDLNLSNPRDAQRLYQRIEGAAHEVCKIPQIRNLAMRSAQDACIRQAVTRAVEQVDSMQVTEIHQAAIQHGVNRS